MFAQYREDKLQSEILKEREKKILEKQQQLIASSKTRLKYYHSNSSGHESNEHKLTSTYPSSSSAAAASQSEKISPENTNKSSSSQHTSSDIHSPSSLSLSESGRLTLPLPAHLLPRMNAASRRVSYPPQYDSNGKKSASEKISNHHKRRMSLSNLPISIANSSFTGGAPFENFSLSRSASFQKRSTSPINTISDFIHRNKAMDTTDVNMPTTAVAPVQYIPFATPSPPVTPSAS